MLGQVGGKKVAYVTNNNSKSRQGILDKLRSMQFPADMQEVFVSSYITARHLSSRNITKVFALGNSGLFEELKNANIDVVTSEAKAPASIGSLSRESFHIDSTVKAVVVGMDFHLSYMKIAHATTYLQQPDVEFIATNLDASYPASGGFQLPGTGAIVSCIQVGSNRVPLVMGKPEQGMFNCILQESGVDVQKVCMIGDRLDTDIAFGKLAGAKTILVWSGVTTPADLERARVSGRDELVPDCCVDSVADLVSLV